MSGELVYETLIDPMDVASGLRGWTPKLAGGSLLSPHYVANPDGLGGEEAT